jgi:hypothetical protein
MKNIQAAMRSYEKAHKRQYQPMRAFQKGQNSPITLNHRSNSAFYGETDVLCYFGRHFIRPGRRGKRPGTKEDRRTPGGIEVGVPSASVRWWQWSLLFFNISLN